MYEHEFERSFFEEAVNFAIDSELIDDLRALAFEDIDEIAAKYASQWDIELVDEAGPFEEIDGYDASILFTEAMA